MEADLLVKGEDVMSALCSIGRRGYILGSVGYLQNRGGGGGSLGYHYR